jgi:hypothetical protein
MKPDLLHQLLPYLPLLVAVALLISRTQRPRVIHPTRLWIVPAILLIAAGFYTVGAIERGPSIHWLGVAVILGTAAAGAAVGALRAHLVRLKRHPDTGAIEATLSAWGLAIILLWMGGRIVLRQSGVAGVETPFGLYTDSALSLALGLVLAQTIVLTLRCRALTTQPPGVVEVRNNAG